MKICNKCKIDKENTEFNVRKKSPDGLMECCKQCRKEYNLLHKDRTKLYDANYKKEHKDEIAQYNYDNKDTKLNNSKIWRDENPEYQINWHIKNPGYRNTYTKSRRDGDIQYKLKHHLGNRLYEFIRCTDYKSQTTISLLGCSFHEFISYIENKFLPEMNWDNYGKIWEMDHIKPMSKFDLTLQQEQQECCNYTNLQPLFKTTKIAESFGYKDYIGNRNKSNKWIKN